jgi:hypothetical protein
MKNSEKNMIWVIVLLMAVGLVLASCGDECPGMGDCNYTYNSATNVGVSNGDFCNVKACNARSAYNNKAKYSAYCDCKK